MAKAPAGGYTVVGPDVAAIGWFPYYYTIADMPANAYTAHRFARPALDWLFDSGNDPPPAQFLGGFQELWNGYRPTMEFRGILCVRNVRLNCNPDGTARDVAFLRAGERGYTPLRAPVRSPWFRFKLPLGHQQGVGHPEHTVLKCPDGVTIEARLPFRLGRLGNYGMYYMTGFEAPDAWMSISYTIKSNADVIVDFNGSSIPTQDYYVNWVVQPQGRHDMLTNTAAEIDAFLQAGPAQSAPRRAAAFRWTGTGQRV
jgi:hypothetical protein